MKTLKIVLAQTEAVPADLDGNLARMETFLKTAADLTVFPAFSLTGANLKDLFARTDFQRATYERLMALQTKVTHPVLLAGIFEQGLQIKYVTKQTIVSLPSTAILTFRGQRLGLGINQFVAADLAINLSARFFQKGDQKTVPPFSALEVNLVGGADEYVYCGGSKIYQRAQLVHQLAYFKAQRYTFITSDETQLYEDKMIRYHEQALCYAALVRGLQDYVMQNHFAGVVLGLSGGIDSALTAVVAVDALGSKRVKVVYLPTRYSSELSQRLVEQICDKLKLKLHVWPIEATYQHYQQELQKHLGSYDEVVDQNIQARIRANFLMGIANQEHLLLLSTGNKSELAMGYTTLYGDMAGGFNLLADLLKTEVYQLANYRNQLNTVFPTEILTRDPTAELSFNQKDRDALPDYQTLDQILTRLMAGENVNSIAVNFDKPVVDWIYERWLRNAFKRKQTGLGLFFVEEKRLPITHPFQTIDFSID